MSDEEKIMQAACDYITSGKAAIADNKQMFKDAVEWRDENPSPKVQEELETLRMQLAACGVAANCNTYSTRKELKESIVRSSPYWSVSYQDVLDAVDREIVLRKKLQKLEKTNMTDEEKIEQAAEEYDADNSYNSGYGPSYAFTDGIEWRDENPSDKVLTLQTEIAAMDQLVIEWQAEYADLYDRGEKLAKALETIADEQGDSDAQQALAEWEKK